MDAEEGTIFQFLGWKRKGRNEGRGKHLGCPYLPNAKAEKIKKLRESGLSFRKIASQVKVSAYCK